VRVATLCDISLYEGGDLVFDAARFEHAVRRAALDLQRMVVLLAQRHPCVRRGVQTTGPMPMTWRQLFDIEEQAFSDLGFQGRHSSDVRNEFVRIADSRLAGSSLDGPVDWRRDEDPFPAVYAIVRALIQEVSTTVS
jgi:hypothetical protein